MPTMYIDYLEPGMILDRDVKNLNGFLLVPAGTELTEKHLYVLRAWGIAEAQVRGTTNDAVEGSLKQDVDPVKLKAAEADLSGVFRHADLSHPALKELFRLCTVRRARKGQETW